MLVSESHICENKPGVEAGNIFSSNLCHGHGDLLLVDLPQRRSTFGLPARREECGPDQTGPWHRMPQIQARPVLQPADVTNADSPQHLHGC